MRKRFVGAAVAGLVSLVGATSVLADRTIIDDPAGDAAANNLDIVSAKAGHSLGQVLKHRVTVAQRVNPNDAPPHLHINIPRKGPGPEFIVRPIALDPGPGPQRGGVFKPGGRHVGKAEITPVGDSGFKFKFREKAINRPKKYGWAWVVSGTDAEVIDRAPDTGYVRHRL
jgi:hypothetical protein